jgi:hypothetical protein
MVSHPVGTFNVASEYVFVLNVLFCISGGVVFNETTSVKFEQPSKAECPILVTLLPRDTDVSPEQASKADPPIFVTLLGMVIDVSPEQL